MYMLQKKFGRLLAVLLFATVVPAVQAEIAIIAHPGTKEIGLSRDKVAAIYLGNIKTYSNGTRVKPIDQANDTPVRSKFYQEVIKKTQSEVNRYWARLKFTGKAKPPRVINGDEAVRDWVASHPGAIGYINGKYLNNTVKVVLILP